MSWKCFCKTSWRCLENVLKTSWQDFLKTPWRRLENVLKISWRCMAKTNMLVLTKTSWRLLMTSSKGVWRLYSSWWRRLEDVLKKCSEDVFKTSSSRRIFARDILNIRKYLMVKNNIKRDTGKPGPGTLQKPKNRDPSRILRKWENRDPSGTLGKPENQDPSRILQKPENRDPSGP